MTRVSRLLHLDDGEFPALRAQIEAKPIPAPSAKKPPNWGRDMIAYLRALDVAATPTIAPSVQTDWSARLANDWTHIADRFDNATNALAREFATLHGACEYAPRVLVAPLLSELAELKAVQLVNWRQALRIEAEAELALYGTPEAGR